jgi:hypothetical protein
MIRFARWLHAYFGFRQLGQPDRQIHIGAWIIDPPSAAVSHAAAGEHHTTEIELAIEALRSGTTNPEGDAAAAALRLSGSCERKRHDEGEERDLKAPPHDRILRPADTRRSGMLISQKSLGKCLHTLRKI